MDSDRLSPAQQRALRASLLSFEKALRSALEHLSQPVQPGILYRRSLRLEETERRALQEQIQQTLHDLEIFVGRLGLEAVDEPLERTIAAEMSLCWESLQESTSSRLRAYGELPPALARRLDPALEEFARSALEIARRVSSNGRIVREITDEEG